MNVKNKNIGEPQFLKYPQLYQKNSWKRILPGMDPLPLLPSAEFRFVSSLPPSAF